MKRIRRAAMLLLILAGPAAWIACGRSGGTEAEMRTPGMDSAARRTLAVIPKGTTHEFWKSIHAGAETAAREMGVRIQWKGPLKEDDRAFQISVVESFIAAGVDGIVLAPLDDKALRAPVANAVRNGIPVVIIDSDLDSQDHASFVATDNRRGGYLGGQRLAQLLEGRGRVVMLRYQEGSASTMNREQGFLDAMAEHPEIEIVSANQYGGATTETAQNAGQSLLTPLRNADGSLNLDGIFCPNESTTFGMLRALQEFGVAGEVYFVGFDSSQKLVTALREGEIHGLVLQNPFRMGYLGVATLVRSLDGETVEPRIDTGVAVVTRENMDEPEMRELLTPDLSILSN